MQSVIPAKLARKTMFDVFDNEYILTTVTISMLEPCRRFGLSVLTGPDKNHAKTECANLRRFIRLVLVALDVSRLIISFFLRKPRSVF